MTHPVLPSSSPDPENPGNLLLSLIPPSDRQRVLDKCSRVELKCNQLIYAAGDPLKYSYFLSSGLASSVIDMGDGRSAEVTSIGHEGLVGIAGVMGAELSPYRCMMLVGGHAWKISPGELHRLSDRNGSLQELLRRYTLMRLLQANQAAACNALHNLTRRLSRWLLKAGDQLNSEMLPLTHEFLAEALGTQRSSISLAAEKLERRGIIAYKRARIRILDRPGLERCSCECYAIVRRSVEAILLGHGTVQQGNPPFNTTFGVSGRPPAA
jgi:CRP-like cAMP-binding protein